MTIWAGCCGWNFVSITAVMTRTAALFIAILVAVSPISAGTQEPIGPIFRSRVAVVPITAVVRDSRKRVVRDLRQAEFRVLEQGAPRRILEFSASSDGPVSVAVLFDTSGSMRIVSNVAKGKEVVSQLLDRMDAKRDEMALFTFHKTLVEAVPFTNDHGRLRAALGDLNPWGATSLYDAVAETAKRVAARPGTRRAVVVISDGLDNSSALTSREVAMLASSIDVPVYVVAVVSPLDHPGNKSSAVAPGAGGALRDLAEFTGGEVFHVSAPDAEVTTGALLAALRHQYFLAIESSAAPGTYALQVATTRKGLHVRARRAYSIEPAVTARQ
jgi:VWFA-related protein